MSDEPTPPEWSLTEHAHLRARRMSISDEHVVAVLTEPELDYPSVKYQGRRVAVRGEVVVPYDPDTREAITVLWKGQEGRQ